MFEMPTGFGWRGIRSVGSTHGNNGRIGRLKS